MPQRLVMRGLRALHPFFWAACLAPLSALAQDPPKDSAPAATAAPAACDTRPGAPPWLPCGPDRVLTMAEVQALLIKPDTVTQIVMTGARTGYQFFLHFKPGGRLDAGRVGATNFGKSWRFEGDKLCRDYYRIQDVHCGTFELQGNALYMLDDDGNKNPVHSVVFAKP